MKKHSILVVEDDIWFAENYVRLLKDEYRITHCTNAYAAMDLIDEVRPSVVILDVLLTGVSAFALLNELQSHTDTGVIPIIICSNIAEDLISISDLRHYGVSKVINKTTMDIDDIRAALKEVI